MKTKWQPNYGWAFAAGVLAWVIPGAGHVLLRRSVRGVIIFLCVSGLFWGGMAIGGVFTVDPVREEWWFKGQLCTGLSGIIGWQRQEQVRQGITARLNIPALPPRSGPSRDSWWAAYTKELVARKLALSYPADGVARAYTGIAGMVNVMCIFDAFMLGLLGKKGEGPVLATDEEAKEAVE